MSRRSIFRPARNVKRLGVTQAKGRRITLDNELDDELENEWLWGLWQNLMVVSAAKIRANGVFDAIPATVSTDTSSGSEFGWFERLTVFRWLGYHPSDPGVRWCQLSQ